MDKLVEIQAVVRIEMLDRVVRQLKDAGCPRMFITSVRSIGAGVDSAFERFSESASSIYAEKAMVTMICGTDLCKMYIELIARVGRTGRQGDGIVWVRSVEQVVKIRTGDHGLGALS